MLQDIETTATQVNTYIAYDDPATQQADMERVGNIFAELLPAEITELTNRTLHELTSDDQADLFKVLAQKLDAQQLAGVAAGLSNPRLPFDPENPKAMAAAADVEADVGDLHNAINRFSPPEVKYAFMATMQRRGPWEPVQPAPSRLTGDPATDAKQAFLDSKLTPERQNDPLRLYPLFMENPKVMSQPIINAHYQLFGTKALTLQGETHVANVVSLALAPIAGRLDPAAVTQLHARIRKQDITAGNLTEDQTTLRNFVVDKITSIGGEKPSVKVWGGVVGLKGENLGLVKTAVFEVTDKNGGPPRFVDTAGRDYGSFQEFQENNLFPAKGVIMVGPKGGQPEYDASGNVKLATLDARIEGPIENARRRLHADEIITTLGVGGMLYLTAGQAGWLAPAATSVLAAKGVLAGTAAYGLLAHGGPNLVNDLRFGDNFNPTENLRPALNATGTALGVATGVQMGTVGLGRTLLGMAGAEAELALEAGAAGLAQQATRHLETATSLVERAKGPMAVGEAIFTRPVTAVLTAGHAGMLAVGLQQTYENWDRLTPAQRLSQGVSLTTGAIGLGMGASRYWGMRSRPAPIADEEALVRTPAGAASALANPGPTGGVLIDSLALKIGGEPFRSVNAPTPTGQTGPIFIKDPAAGASARTATWFKAGETPEEVATAYANLVNHRNPSTPVADVLSNLKDKSLLVVSKPTVDGKEELIGGATVETNFSGTRTLSLGSITTPIPIRRDGGGAQLKAGDAHLSNVASVEGGERELAGAAIEGVTLFTDAKRLLWSSVAGHEQLQYERLVRSNEFPGLRRSYATTKQDAVDLVCAIPADQRTPNQNAALALPTRRQQLAALADLTHLPNGARELGYEVPIKRELTTPEKIYKVTSPDSYMGQLNSALNPIGRSLQLVNYVQSKFAMPEVVATYPPVNGSGVERTATVYPPGTLSQAEAYEQAQSVIDANKFLPGNPYAKASVGAVAEQLNALYVVRITETIKDAAGQPITRLMGGSSVRPNWKGPENDGRWLNRELPHDASYLSHVFGTKGGGTQATEAAKLVAARLGSTELNFYTRWPDAQTLYQKLKTPVVDATFTREAAQLLLDTEGEALDLLPNPVRNAVAATRALPPAEQAAALSRTLKEIELVDFHTTFVAAQKLYNSLLTPARTSFAPTAAGTLLKADPMAVDGLPDNIRNAVVTARALPAAERTAALSQSLSSLDPKTTPMLQLPNGVQRVSYRQPIEVGESWLSTWTNGAWRWTRETTPTRQVVDAVGTVRGRPVNPVEIQTFPKAGETEGVDRVATLYPPGTLSPKDLAEQAKLTLEANSSLPNSPYARYTPKQLADELKKLFVIQVRDAQQGKLVGGAALARQWEGPYKDGRWLDSSLPKNTSYLSHVWGSRGAGEQATLAAQKAAGSLLLSNDLAFYTRWQGAQNLYGRLGTQTVDATFTKEAVDILLQAGPATFQQLPPAFQEAVSTARRLPGFVEPKQYMAEFLSKVTPADYATQLPNGVLKVSYMQPIGGEKTPGQTWVDAQRDQVQQVVLPALAAASKVAGRVNEAINPFGGPQGIEPGPVRQTLRDVLYTGREARNFAFKWGGGALALSSAAQLVTGSSVVHEDDDRVTGAFNVKPGSASYSVHFPWTSTTLTAWGTGPAFRGMYGLSENPSLPMARVGPPPGNPTGPSSATGVLAMRANLGEVGLGLQIGNNETAWRGAAGVRLANVAFNVRGDIPFNTNAARWVSLLTSVTPSQPYVTTGFYSGKYGIVDRDLQLILGPALGMVRQTWAQASKASYLFADNYGHIGGKVTTSQGYFLSLNAGHGKPEPVWSTDTDDEAAELATEE